MRRALGPFLTTGVALVAATVVVANPLAPPSRDMQISTTQLSTSPDLLSPSDKSLLSALTPQLPTAGIGPALAQILAALAADADRISREVSSEIGTAPPLTMALAEQTAYRPEPVAPSFIESTNAALAAPTGFASEVVSSQVVSAINGLVADTGYLGGKVVEAAFAVVDVIVRVPQFVFTAVLDLLSGDIAGVVETIRNVVRAFWGPGLIILDGIRDVLYGRHPAAVAPPAALKALVAAATPRKHTETPPASTEPSAGDPTAPPAARDAKAGSARKHESVPSPASLKLTTTATKTADSTGQDTDTATPKPRSSSKPATGAGHGKAGSARGGKSSASGGSSAR